MENITLNNGIKCPVVGIIICFLCEYGFMLYDSAYYSFLFR
jgi:hypothetical protein